MFKLDRLSRFRVRGLGLDRNVGAWGIEIVNQKSHETRPLIP